MHEHAANPAAKQDEVNTDLPAGPHGTTYVEPAIKSEGYGKGSKKKKDQEERSEVVGEEKKGLYANIHAKRKRGEKMRSKGDKGAPSEQDFKDSAKTAKKESFTFKSFRSIAEKK